jgi:hypothetical protein
MRSISVGRRNGPTQLAGSERGSTSLELVVWAVPMLLFIGLLIVGGRLAMAGNAVQSAAFAAARDATLTRSAASAQVAGEDAARFSLDSSGIDCVSRTVIVDVSDFNRPIGQSGVVDTTLICRVNLSDAGLPGLPGSIDIQRTASSPVDPYRQRL